jgi:hypothetical protein
MSLLIGTLLAAGLALLSQHPIERLRLAGAAGATVLLWRSLWQVGNNILVAKLPPAFAHGPMTEGILTLSVGSAAMLVTAAVITLAFAFFGTARPTPETIYFVPAWVAGLILPALGRNGSWPLTSISLAVAVLFLGLVLGILLATIAPLSGRDAR